MQKLLFMFLFCIFFMIFSIASYVSAAEVSLGASAWYSWWKFNNNDNMELDPALLYGPILSIRLNDSWSLSGVFLYGRFNSSNNDEGPGYITRLDSDISLNYNINRYFKVFAGDKYMGFNWKEQDGKGSHWSTGPGLGIGCTLPLVENLYFLLNISGIYSWGKHEPPSGSETPDTNLVETGFNTNVSLAYYIRPASTSINLGFRYQYINTDYKYESPYNNDESFSFYGITLSAVYSF